MYITAMWLCSPLQLEREQLPFEPLPSALQYIIHTKVRMARLNSQFEIGMTN